MSYSEQRKRKKEVKVDPRERAEKLKEKTNSKISQLEGKSLSHKKSQKIMHSGYDLLKKVKK